MANITKITTVLISMLSAPIYAFSLSNTYVSGVAGYSSSFNAGFSVASPGTGYTNPTRDISDSYGNSGVYGVALGYHFIPALRAEVAYNIRPNFEYNQTDADPATDRQRFFDVQNQTAMVNAYLDVAELAIVEKNKFGIFSPYVGGGVGSSWNNTGQLNAITVSTGQARPDPIAGTQTNSFSWQLMAGTLLNIKDNVSLEVGYRYVNIGKISLSDHYTNTVERPQTISVLSASSAAVQDVFAGLHYRFS